MLAQIADREENGKSANDPMHCSQVLLFHTGKQLQTLSKGNVERGKEKNGRMSKSPSYIWTYLENFVVRRHAANPLCSRYYTHSSEKCSRCFFLQKNCIVSIRKFNFLRNFHFCPRYVELRPPTRNTSFSKATDELGGLGLGLGDLVVMSRARHQWGAHVWHGLRAPVLRKCLIQPMSSVSRRQSMTASLVAAIIPILDDNYSYVIACHREKVLALVDAAEPEIVLSTALSRSRDPSTSLVLC